MVPSLLGICGFARVGKNTVGDALTDFYGYRQLAFADRLRELAWRINPELGGVVRRYGYETAKDMRPDIRAFLVNLGDGARELLGQNVWLDAVLPEGRWGLKWDGPPTVCTDVRYRNEAERIRNLGGVVIKVRRPAVGPANDQERISIAEITYDHLIINDGTINDLVRQVHDFMERQNAAQ